ncbi:MAG: CPXCG motif-containing cysteine-rich protein [Pseudomonadales bacterium]|nr:CPXCG motif-containing cysteine-rich protein [Pseudomonadales bacterium]
MYQLFEKSINCPYCAAQIEVVINSEDCGQSYIEDCQVCCRPINFLIGSDTGQEPSVEVFSENDCY